MRWRHKASGAALGLSCVACFEQPAGVFAGCGASTHLLVNTISREIHLARAGWRLQKPLNPSQHTLTAPFRGHTASALLQRASPLFDFHRKSHCRSNAARDRAYSNVDSSLQIIADTPVRRLMAPSLMWIPSSNIFANVGFACAKTLNPSRLQRNGHSEESPLDELPAAVTVAAGLCIFRLRCRYASSHQYHLP